MKAHIRSFSSADIDVDNYLSPNPAMDGQWIRMLIGPADSPGEESFDVLICTARWLEKQIESKGPLTGRHLFIANRFDLHPLLDQLRDLVEATAGSDWTAISEKLARIGYWEFEDYQPFKK